jgi:hypothetical protein
VDCNGAFSLKRFAQILKDEAILKTLILAQPKSFLLQTQIIQQLKKFNHSYANFIFFIKNYKK